MNDEEFLLKLREAFSVETEEHLQAMTSSLLDLEKAATPDRRKEVLETIFREAHSLKGAAHAVNRTDIESVCQALESVFAAWKRQNPEVSAETFDVLNTALDFVEKLREQSSVAAVASSQDALQEVIRGVTRLVAPVGKLVRPAPLPSAPLLGQPSTALPVFDAEQTHPEPEKSGNLETVRVTMRKMDALLLQAEEMVAVKQVAGRHFVELRELGVTLQQWRKEWARVRTATRPAEPNDGPGAEFREFLEWNESQLDAFDEKLTALAKVTERDERIVGSMVDDLLDNTKQLAMQPFARLLGMFPKQIRDLSREQGKEIELLIRGSDVEIDKRILEEMKTPLIHLIRNAIDHGLEKPEVRRQCGKPEQGSLQITILQRDGHKVEIVVSDDGEGIDLARVKASALKSEVVTEAEAGQLNEAATLALIFQSGVSTSPLITEISGRGLGMAIVREKVEKLGGQISIETKPNVGTTFRIVLPVTLATFKGILVQAGGQTFVIPISSVERITRVKREEIKTVENREAISYKGKPLSLAWLADVLELSAREPKETPSFVEVLVLSVAEQRVAFAVEAVLNEQEVLVKRLNKPLVRVRNISAATVLASGTPALILNTADLLQSAIRLATSGPSRKGASAVVPLPTRARRVLVADDSVTSRMLLKNILESAGYQVTTAVDGVEAFTAMRGGEFDVIVSDVEMPRMDGFELTMKIRADKEYAELPVVLVTALGSREHHERGIDVGANAYIVKSSFDQSNLLEVIRRLV
jgi:two-component system chemotaxis sensor kinase CheA